MEGGGGTKVARRGGGRREEEEGSILFPPSPFHSPSPPPPPPTHSSSLLRIAFALHCIAIALFVSSDGGPKSVCEAIEFIEPLISAAVYPVYPLCPGRTRFPASSRACMRARPSRGLRPTHGLDTEPPRAQPMGGRKNICFALASEGGLASGHRPWVGHGVRSVSNPWAGARLCDSL